MPFYKGFHYRGLKQWRNYGVFKKTFGKYFAVVSLGPAKVAVWTSKPEFVNQTAAEKAAKEKIDSGDLDKFKPS